MPRAGSFAAPPGGGGPPAPMDIGSVANPPFALLPDPEATFRRRRERFEALAAGSGDLAPWLAFLARVSAAQAAALDGLPAARLPSDEDRARSLAHGMPPLGREGVSGDPAARAALDALLAHLAAGELTEEARTAVGALRDAAPEARAALLDEALVDEPAGDGLAGRVLAAAALQVHMARLASRLDAGELKRITDGACPACGAAVAASAVVGWEGAANTRFCACSVCATQWHVVRVRCLSCGDEGKITFHGVEGGDENLKAESCGACKAYVKIVYQNRDAALDPAADDAASLALDLMLAERGFHRFGRNPFLIGY